MRKIRVLVVDDAVAVRRLLTEVIASNPALELVGTAPNGRVALAKVAQFNPDLVTLDVEMPEMDGLQTLVALRRSHPRLPVIMFSALTQAGAAATLEALSLGADDYVTKPSGTGSLAAALEQVRGELLPRITALASRAVPADPTPPLTARARPEPVRRFGQRIEVVAIGVSTGGPNALGVLVPQLPADLPVPVVIVQHMPPIFTGQLAGRLDAKSMLSVREGAAGEILAPGQVWLAPGGYHMATMRRASEVTLSLHQGPPENSCRPAVDVLFRSVAEAYGSATLAVVLTGMGQDGLRGCECVRAAGGQVLVQDEASSVVWGMPGFVARAGLADQVVPLDGLVPEIVRRARAGRPAARTS